ncbi:MAG: hypothetical protein H6Q51_545 [Deltaproteobacteria bacterium]|nr:hypothetical protein [Deltaproteobacteria bacterium]
MTWEEAGAMPGSLRHPTVQAGGTYAGRPRSASDPARNKARRELLDGV